MKHGSLFSGIGGFDLAAEWMGWTNEFHCEWNEFGQKVLKYYWPKATSYADITKTDFNIHRGRIDILSGGFPCQPYSSAGKRLGKEDDRHLWPEMLRAIREIQPRWVVGENVLGLVNWNGGLVFDEVQADLEAEGYNVQPYVLPAASVGAPHRRDRVWFVAYRSSERRDNGSNNWQERHIQNNFNGNASESESERSGRLGGSCEAGQIGDASYANGTRREEQHITAKPSEKNINSWNAMHPHSTSIPGQHIRQEGQGKSNRSNSRDGVNGFENFPTQSPICTRNDGLSSRLDGITFPKWRNESIKAAGNAIVPQVALQIFKAIEEYENLKQ